MQTTKQLSHLAHLFARDEATEQWLQTEVAAAYDVLKADPSQRVSSADLRRSLGEVVGHLTIAERRRNSV